MEAFCLQTDALFWNLQESYLALRTDSIIKEEGSLGNIIN